MVSPFVEGLVISLLSGAVPIAWDAIQIRNATKKRDRERDRAALVIQRAYRSYRWKRVSGKGLLKSEHKSISHRWKRVSNGHFFKSGHI